MTNWRGFMKLHNGCTLHVYIMHFSFSHLRAKAESYIYSCFCCSYKHFEVQPSLTSIELVLANDLSNFIKRTFT